MVNLSWVWLQNHKYQACALHLAMVDARIMEIRPGVFTYYPDLSKVSEMICSGDVHKADHTNHQTKGSCAGS